MRKKFNKILGLVFSGVLLLPSIGLAGLKLEQNYPAISGITGQSESLNTAVSQTAKNAPTNTVSLIKYLFSLAIVVLIGLATLAVIIAGVQYLSSAGKVTAQKLARTRLIKAFIGLAIVVSASLILQIISPSLDIPELTHIYNSASNVILISQPGMAQLSSADITKEYLDKLADQGLIKYFGSQSGDLTQNFGRLIKYSDAKVSFEDFRPAYIGFYGKGKNNIQVKTFSGTNFLGTINTYKAETGGTDAGNTGSEKITYFALPTYKSTLSNIQYFDTTTGNPDEPQIASKSPSNYPPLSMLVEGISGGVYLFGGEGEMAVRTKNTEAVAVGDGSAVAVGDVEYAIGKGGQRFLQYDIPNFGDSSFDFDEQANAIEIKNNRLADPSVQDDFLVFLFQGKYFQGPFRAFFEKTTNSIPIATLFTFHPEDKWYNNKGNQDMIKTVFDSRIEHGGSFITDTKPYYPESITIGNTAENAQVDLSQLKRDDANGSFQAMDQQGKVVGVSSARVFHLAEFDKNNKVYKSTCQAVALCNATDLQGYCLVFTANGKNNGKFMSFFLPMPWFTPIPLPDRFPEYMRDALLASPEQKMAYLEEKNGTKGFKDNTEFDDNIKSIGIKGNCVVALYDNTVKNFQKCLAGTLKDCWDNDTPGEKSMVFAKSDMVSGVSRGGEGEMPYLNLKNYQIHSCVSRWSALRLTPPHSCVSAVAVYPVK